MKYAAVIAAAGLSSRMKEFKPMLTLGEHTVIERVIQNLREAGAEEIVVVTGYRSQLLERFLEDRGVKVRENPDYAQTKMFDSLCLGLRALEAPYDAVFLTPGDVPLVQPETIRAMRAVGAHVVRPVCGGQTGHPVLLAAACVPELLSYSGEEGLRGALEALDVSVEDIEVDDVGILLDADTPEDFRVLRRKAMEDRSGGGLWAELQVSVGKGDVILTPETAQFLEMIGHTGSIQSACACVHMSYTKGWRLLNQIEKAMGYPLVERFPGGVSGGGSTLTPRGRSLLEAYQRFRDEVRREGERLFDQCFPEELQG